MLQTRCPSASVSLALSLNASGCIILLWPSVLTESFLLLSLRSCWQPGPSCSLTVPSRRAWVSWLESDNPPPHPTPPHTHTHLYLCLCLSLSLTLLLTDTGWKWLPQHTAPSEHYHLASLERTRSCLNSSYKDGVVWCCPVWNQVFEMLVLDCRIFDSANNKNVGFDFFLHIFGIKINKYKLN